MTKSVEFRLCILSSLLLLSCVQPSIGATITPVQPGASASYIPTAGPVACGPGTCQTTLNPLGVGYLAPITALGGLRDTLNAEFPGQYTVAPGPAIGLGTPVDPVFLNVQRYEAVNDGVSAGGNFVMSITGLNASNTPVGTMHWVQWVRNNYNFTGDNGATVGTAPTGPGQPEDTIDGHFEANTPFYDVASAAAVPPFNTTPPANPFQDGSRRPEPTAANPVINWDAWLYVVVAGQTGAGPNGTTLLTFYDGVNWGWTATYIAPPPPVPLPAAWTMMLFGLGILGLAKRYRSAARVA